MKLRLHWLGAFCLWSLPLGINAASGTEWSAVRVDGFGRNMPLVSDMTNSGMVLGTVGTSSQPFLYKEGRLTDPSSGGAGAVISAMNQAGDVVGWETSPQSDQVRSFLTRNGVKTFLSTPDDARAIDINDRGQILVNGSPFVQYPFVINPNGSIAQMGLQEYESFSVNAVGINNKGQVLEPE